MIQIINRFDSSVIFECEEKSIKLAVELAIKQKTNLSGANLYGVNLSGANLSWANLYGVNLSWANLSGANLYGVNLSGANLSWANLSGANLSGVNLSGADLSWANLSGVNLSGADLYGANLYGEKIDKTPIQIFGLDWWINITKKHIQIGCQIHEANEWFEFTDEKISGMHGKALKFWNTNKEFIKQAWENHCKDSGG